MYPEGPVLERDEVIVRVKELMTESIVSVDANASVIEAAKLMRDKVISSIIVKSQGELVGIITDRDILARVVSTGLDGSKITVAAVMSSPLLTIDENASVDEAAKIMANHNIRRLVVESGGQKIGVIAESDMIRVDPEIHFLIRERSRLNARIAPNEPQRVTLAGYCEECGNYSAQLRKSNGRWLDEDCFD
jgi:signal-transduction protein with cAMP-binding, CBS, and nucleotidyltransferase domain